MDVLNVIPEDDEVFTNDDLQIIIDQKEIKKSKCYKLPKQYQAIHKTAILNTIFRDNALVDFRKKQVVKDLHNPQSIR